MRIWDLHPGYLNRQSLLGEHRELHGIVSILQHGKKGYSKHPETLRWVDHAWALTQRHRLLVCEMQLRGYHDRSPVTLDTNPFDWPSVYIDEPAQQVAILKAKYRDREPGRIPLPKNAQELWAHHKYSVMARDISSYKAFGNKVADYPKGKEMDAIAMELIDILRMPPQEGLHLNVLQHMWGYVSQYTELGGADLESLSSEALLKAIQELALTHDVTYLIQSTALSELGAWSG